MIWWTTKHQVQADVNVYRVQSPDVCFLTFSPVPSSPLGLVVLGMTCFYWGEAHIKQLHKDWNSLLSQTLLYVPSVTHIVYTNMLANVYRTVAQSLTEYGEWGRGGAIRKKREGEEESSDYWIKWPASLLIMLILLCVLREPQRRVSLRKPSDSQSLGG